MLIKELNLPTINPLRNLLSNLMRRPSFNHIQPGPPILRLRTRRRADEKIVLELTLKSILLDVVRQRRWNLPTKCWY